MKRVIITSRNLSPAPLIKKVQKDEHGAVVVFLGVVRNRNQNREVVRLEYEAYREMALKKIEQIIDEVKGKWGIEDIVIAHRLGTLSVGEVSLIIVVASPHRAEAFEVCQYSVDRLKEIVPIWKKEIFTDGEVWAGPQK